MLKKFFLQKDQLQNGRSILGKQKKYFMNNFLQLSKIFVNKKCKEM